MNATVRLTKREEQIAELIAWGAAKKEVPDLLPIRPGRRPIAIQTVENTVRNIYEKLGIQKVNELSAWYFCSHFQISFNLSPLKRRFVAFALLLCILPTEVMIIKEALRPRMNSRACKSISRTPIRRKDDTYNLELV